MDYRRLGRTEKQVSILGVGGGYVMLLDLEAGTRLYRRAAELGIGVKATSEMELEPLDAESRSFAEPIKKILEDEG